MGDGIISGVTSMTSMTHELYGSRNMGRRGFAWRTDLKLGKSTECAWYIGKEEVRTKEKLIKETTEYQMNLRVFGAHRL